MKSPAVNSSSKITSSKTRKITSRRLGLFGLLLWLAPIPLTYFAASSVALIALSMLPTMVAAIVDRRYDNYTAYTVGGFNLSGTLPFLAQLWMQSNGNTIPGFVDVILKTPFPLLTIYGASCLGWIFYTSASRVTVYFSDVRDRMVLASMISRQEEIVEQWGVEVTYRGYVIPFRQ